MYHVWKGNGNMLIFKEAQDQDMYDILDVRNSAREFFTHNTNYITTAEQYDFWKTKEENGYKLWLVIYQDSDPGDCEKYLIGFCMLRTMYDSGRIYGTLALYKQYRGNGYGTEIYKFLVAQNDETWIDVRNDNMPSIVAAYNAGFKVHYRGEDISEMVYRKET